MGYFADQVVFGIIKVFTSKVVFGCDEAIKQAGCTNRLLGLRVCVRFDVIVDELYEVRFRKVIVEFFTFFEEEIKIVDGLSIFFLFIGKRVCAAALVVAALRLQTRLGYVILCFEDDDVLQAVLDEGVEAANAVGTVPADRVGEEGMGSYLQQQIRTKTTTLTKTHDYGEACLYSVLEALGPEYVHVVLAKFPAYSTQFRLHFSAYRTQKCPQSNPRNGGGLDGGTTSPPSRGPRLKGLRRFPCVICVTIRVRTLRKHTLSQKSQIQSQTQRRHCRF